jgi:exopolysaccharide biosynthesis protein
MRSLGAVDAMNLDGGGSTSFVVAGQTINHPSDATGARAVGDSIEIVP